MLNFSYANPTRLVFGRSAEHEVGRVMTSILGRPGKVLVLFGGGSAHRHSGGSGGQSAGIGLRRD